MACAARHPRRVGYRCLANTLDPGARGDRDMTTLAVLGAGVKAVAVAAKAHVLRQMGVGAPDVVAIERLGGGETGQASGGWTDGAQRLGTSPEKDVGFPYRSSLAPRRNAELDERMTRHSSEAHV